jgi:hypothetical protein
MTCIASAATVSCAHGIIGMVLDELLDGDTVRRVYGKAALKKRQQQRPDGITGCTLSHGGITSCTLSHGGITSYTGSVVDGES